MAIPYIFESNFEQGTNAEWDSETDTGSLLDFPHYSELSRLQGAPMPYRGAYCMRITPGDTNDHTLTEGDIDIADGATRYFRWYLYASPNFTATADDVFSIFELQQAGGTVEQTVGMRITASSNLLEIGVGDGTAPSSYWTFERGKWVCVELLSTISTGGAGAMTLFLGGTQVIALTSLTQAAAVGQGVLGTQLTLATTTGTLYFDCFAMDDARIFPFQKRFPSQINVTKSTHLFVGPGVVDGASLLTTTSDNTMVLYDTDTAETTHASSTVANMDNGGISGVSGPIFFERGCYAALGGTTPAGIVYLTQSSEKPGVFGPVHYSHAGMRLYGQTRKTRVAA